MGEDVPVISVVMAAECSHQARRVDQCLHEWDVCAVVIDIPIFCGFLSLLSQRVIIVDTRLLVGIDTLGLECCHGLNWDMVECERWNGLFIERS